MRNRVVCNQLKMADSWIILSINILVIITFFLLYGLKWAFLIGITILLWTIYLSASNSRESGNGVKINADESLEQEVFDHSDIDLLSTENSDPGVEYSGYRTRLVKNIVRRNPTLTQEPFNDVPMYRNRQPARMSNLRSPEPLLSHVTKHLSFNNTSYYNPDKTRHSLSSSDKTILNTSTPSRWYTIPDTSVKQQSFMVDQSSSLLQERNSPRQFNIVSPSRNDLHNTSTVKIGRPEDNDSRFALESILHKRLERTKDNPCSRQSVLSALGQKTRKRSAYDSDSSMVEPYSAKKRRRDELDDFLDVVNNPSSSPSTTYTGVKSNKRSYSDSISEKPTSEITRKRSKEKKTSHDHEPSLALRHVGGSNTFEDSGVDMNSPNRILQENGLSQAKVVPPEKQRKRKSVTFSDKLVNEDESKKTSQLTCEDGKTKDTNNLNNDSSKDNAPVFHVGFSPRKSLTSDYLSSISNCSEKTKVSPRRYRSSNITWKDLQENRREAWRRSQKLLDEIEESLAKEKVPTPSSVDTATLSTTMTSSLTSTMTSLPISSVSFVTNVQTTTEQARSTTVAGQLTNFIGVKPTNTLFVRTGSKTTQSMVSGGQQGTTSGFVFSAPKSSPKSSATTGLFSGTLSTPPVSSSAQSLLSTSNTSSKANTASQPSFSFVSSGSTSQVAATPSTTFSFQSSTGGLSTGSVKQTTMPVLQTTIPVLQNTTPGLFNAGSLVANTVQNTSNISVSTSSAAPAKSGGFSFSATAVTKSTPTSGFSFNAAAAPNVSGGFQTTQTGEKTLAQKPFAFNAPTTQKPNASGGFAFTAPASEKSSASGNFSLTAPTNEKPNTNGGFNFSAPTTEKQSTSGGFTFNAATSNKPNTSGGFTFTAPVTNKESGIGSGFQLNNNNGFKFTAPVDNKANVNSGFTFNSNTNKPTNSGGFNNLPTFNFAGTPAPAGGFNFTSSTPIPSNSGRTSTNLAKTRQRRRPKR